jgi:UDP-2,3-diacylglucosamine hydrolase
LKSTKKIFFVSDFHLGMPNGEVSLAREKSIVEWLEYCAPNADVIYLMGDIFDFWFEYKKVVPRGFVRFLGTLAKITDNGTKVIMFPGNHDLWLSEYLLKECGVELITKEFVVEHHGKRFFLHHGDGLGPGDHSYKFLKKIFLARFARFLFRWLHPDIGVAMAHRFSKKSRLAQNPKEDNYLGDQQEYLTQFALSHAQGNVENPIDYYIFGHRHLVLNVHIAPKSRYINLGEWLHGSQYAVFDGQTLDLLNWPNNTPAQPKNV